MRVGIVGCGYVGLELGRQLAAAGHDAVGVRRSESGLQAVRDAGLRAVRADVTEPETLSAVPDADAVVFAASAGGRGAAAARETYVDGLAATVAAFGERESAPERFVYTSSTGVYGDHDGAWVDEDTDLRPETERERVLVDAEQVVRERAPDHGMDATVVRFAGLYGPGRYFVERYLDGPVTEGWLNLVHRDDAAGIVQFALTGDGADADTLLAVDDEPVWKPDLAQWLADECGVEPPAVEPLGDDASPRSRAQKRCSNRRLHDLGYEFAYPTFREGLAPAVADWRRGESS
jgi:nucleoside-diphosphate-sugar epimerase